MATLVDQLTAILNPAIEDAGFELWGMETQRVGKFLTLRIFIDSPKGVTIDDCADVSRLIGAILDVEDPIVEKYNLEVSSPGLDRQIFTLAQMARYVGEDVVLNLRIPQANRRKWQGKLTEINGDMLSLEVDKVIQQFAFGNIQKSQLVAKISIKKEAKK